MNKKKHIDRLFQDKLQNFEATPSDAVWKNINAKLSLDNEKRKRVIPLWFKITGIAAGLLLLITLSNALFFNNEDPNTSVNEVVNTNENTNSETQKEQNTTQKDIIKGNNLNTNTTVATDNTLNTTDDNISNTSIKETSGTNEASSSNASLNTYNDRNKNVVATSTSSNITNTNGSSNKNQTVKTENKTSNTTQNRSNTTIASTTDSQKNNTVTNTENKDRQPNIDKDKVDELVKETKQGNTTKAVTDATENKGLDITTSTTDAQEEGKTSIQDELEKADEEKEVIDEEKLNKKRWSVSPNIAPVYFNSLGSGSSIDSKFNNSNKTGEINMSYGVAANYAISDKLTVRAGVNQVNLGYNTNDVIVYNNIQPSDNGKPLRNVALNQASQTLSFLSADGLNFAEVPDVVATNISSSIEQRLGFVEVPVELEYKLSDKKLGFSVIGGFSTLFLTNNEVYSTLQNDRRLIGEATNVNKTSFSANLGVGLKYKMSEKINLNLEPVFKYQLNTFSDTSGDFKPYVIGVYTGFSFRF